MAFSGLTFPSLQYGNRFRGTHVQSALPVSVVANGGYEYRTLRFGYPRRSWTISARNLTWQDKETLLEFYHQVGGELNSFLYTDPDANSLSNYAFGAGTQINAPATPTLVSTTGTLAAATYTYAVTAYNAEGETLPSTAANITLSATGGVTVNWTAVAGATGYRVYGRSGTLGRLADVGNVLTYTDSGSATPGVASPSVNGTGTLQYAAQIPVGGLAHPLFHVGTLAITPSNYTLQVINGMPYIVYLAGSAPAYGSNVVGNGSFQVCARFDMTAGFALANAVAPSTSAVQMDAIKLVEVFE